MKKGTKRTGKIELYRDDDGKHRWRIIASNGRILADSGEGYARSIDCERGLAVVLSGARAWGRFTL